MKTFIRILLLLCLTAPTAALVKAAAAPVNLVVWGIGQTSETKDVNAEIAAFERMHPNINVVTLNLSGAQNPQKLMTAIVGGVPPDIINQDRFTIGDWASRGAFHNLDDLIAADERTSDPLAIRRRSFLPATLAETMYQGHVFAIPYTVDDRILYYNKKSFRDAGLDPNHPPQTWDEMMADAKKLTVPAPGGGFSKLGFDPEYVQGALYLWSWQEDGEFMSPDGRVCTLANSRTTAALKSMVSWYDQLGGIDAVNGFAGSFGSETGAQDPFISGSLAMKTDDTTFINAIARYAPDMDFGVVPVPVPAERLHHEGIFKNDPTWVTWSGGFSLVIPRGARHPKEAWQFMRWITSPQAALIGAKAQAEYQHSKDQLYVPNYSANAVANRQVFATYLPLLTPNLRRASETALNLLPVTKYRPVTFVGLLLSDQSGRATDAALRHSATPEQALLAAQQAVQRALDAKFNENQHPLLPARRVVGALAALALAGTIGLIIGAALWMRRNPPAKRAEGRAGLLFISPWIFGFLIFTLGPIIASLVLSFCDYDVLHSARWAGLNNYHDLVTTDRPLVLKSLGNVAYLALIGIPLGMATGLAMALLLNSKVSGIRWYRAAFYIPSIVPVVASSVLWLWILNSDPHRGLINAAWLGTLTHWFGIAPPGWETVPQWSKPGLIIMGLWGAGGGMILWLAGLQSIPATLYEASSLDGASGWVQFWRVTLPMLSPYIFFNLIMGIIGTLQTFDSSYILGNTGNGGTTGPDDSLMMPVVYLFSNAFQYFKMGYASAIAWLLFILILGLTLGQLKLAPRWVHYETEAR